MGKLRITQIKSGIDRTKRQKDTLIALGLRKMHQTVEKENIPSIVGMVKTVEHLIKVEKI